MLTVHRAERADRLAAALAGVLAPPPDDPFAADVVAIPTRGVERWLTQRLSTSLGTGDSSRGDGVCANVEFPFPHRLLGQATAAATDVDPDEDPWAAERAVWPLLTVVDEHLDEEWLAALARHLRGRVLAEVDASLGQRRFATVRHLADLFDGYATNRPAMVEAWAAGDDVDAHGVALPADGLWQPRLWRALRERIGVPSPAERLGPACDRLRTEPALLDGLVPARLSLFGLTRLPASQLAVLRAIAVGRDVHLFVLHPSDALWRRASEAMTATAVATTDGPVRRGDDPTAALSGNPLLTTWGRDVRELQVVLQSGADGADADVHHGLEAEPATLLQRLQADVRHDVAPPRLGDAATVGADRWPLDRGDRSVQVHACHGRSRQVEVLRDAILHVLADDPTLEPRDVIVMCPDVETFAPLIHATFGVAAGEETDAATTGGGAGDGDADAEVIDLRVRLADRSIRQTNPVLAVASELLTLAGSRVTASEVLDLAGREPVRRRFGFDDDDLARMEEWAAAAGIRWGLDADHRAPFQLQRVEANTWRAGLERILLGVTMDEEGSRLVEGRLPLDDVDSGDVDLAGRMAELVERLHLAVDSLQGPMPLDRWLPALTSAVDLLCAVADRDDWQRAQLQWITRDLLAESAAAVVGDGPGLDLGLHEVRAVLSDRLRGRPTRANFRTGHLTVCTLHPMRSVPHRVVCLLGIDDGVFPRTTATDGDDLLARRPCVGDRDPRTEDRQLLLDALLAASDHLIVTYNGRDERTNAPVPPAVPLGELLDVVDRTAVHPDGPDRPAREHVVVHHPLQPFDCRGFTPGALVADRPWSFDRIALAGAAASTGERRPRPSFLDRPLEPLSTDVVELDDLVRFLQHPTKAFLRQRLGVVVSQREDVLDDALPVELDGLRRWQIGDRLVTARLAGVDADRARAAELARGDLPPGDIGIQVLDDVAAVAEAIVKAARLVGDEPAVTVDVNVALPTGRMLVGTVGGVIGDVAREVTYSGVGPNQRLAAWVRLLALTADDPTRPWQAVTVAKKGWGAGTVRLPPLGSTPEEREAAAHAHLAVIADLYERGMREPLPIFPRTSHAYATARRDPEQNPVELARKEWETEGKRYGQGEDQALEHQLVLRGVLSFDEVERDGFRADEDGPGWVRVEGSRFGRYARRLWDPVLDHLAIAAAAQRTP